MKNLVSNLLDLSRLDSGTMPIKREQCDISDITADCIETLNPLAKSKNISLKVELLPAPCKGDSQRIMQVVTNLLSNAINYTNFGGEISIHTGEKEGHAELKIFDNGIGMSQEQLTHIYERFYRADNSRTRSTGGTGLGLSICKSIIDAHGAEIFVQSQVDKGTSFRIVF